MKKVRENNIPVLVLTAKDEFAAVTLLGYWVRCVEHNCSKEHKAGVLGIYRDFVDYKSNNEDKMKLPD